MGSDGPREGAAQQAPGSVQVVRQESLSDRKANACHVAVYRCKSVVLAVSESTRARAAF